MPTGWRRNDREPSFWGGQQVGASPFAVQSTNWVNVMPNYPGGMYTPPPPPAVDGWTIYDVLIRCVESARWSTEEERLAAIAVVEQLRAANALGTQASMIQLSTEEEGS